MTSIVTSGKKTVFRPFWTLLSGYWTIYLKYYWCISDNVCLGFIPCFIKHTAYMAYLRPETPPNTPQRARIALQELERAARELESPPRRRTPAGRAPRPIPFSLGQATSNEPTVGPDPFALPATTSTSSASTSYSHLPAELRAQLATLPSLPPNPPQYRQRQVFPLLPQPVPLPPLLQTPAPLQAQAAALLPLPNAPPPPLLQTPAQLHAQAATLPPLPNAPQVR